MLDPGGEAAQDVVAPALGARPGPQRQQAEGQRLAGGGVKRQALPVAVVAPVLRHVLRRLHAVVVQRRRVVLTHVQEDEDLAGGDVAVLDPRPDYVVVRLRQRLRDSLLRLAFEMGVSTLLATSARKSLNLSPARPVSQCAGESLWGGLYSMRKARVRRLEPSWLST